MYDVELSLAFLSTHRWYCDRVAAGTWPSRKLSFQEISWAAKQHLRISPLAGDDAPYDLYTTLNSSSACANVFAAIFWHIPSLLYLPVLCSFCAQVTTNLAVEYRPLWFAPLPKQTAP